uniref:Uncharacterized protein LOC111132716 n=1 Tax=Crassostrea virginica TaxID=6565 RepID=A0A8B8E6K6_CRAVI|nr:uncharacterized protein LOC111132716 [Crassostrea virginica]
MKSQEDLGGPLADQGERFVGDHDELDTSETDSTSGLSSSSEEHDVNGLSSDENEEDEAIPLPSDLENSSFFNESEYEENKYPGYSVCWDNVQKLSISRHSLRRDNKMMLWALCFAAKNRISFCDLSEDDVCSVRDIGIEKYLPSVRDWQELKQRMEHVVQIIVKRHFSQFNEVDIPSCLHEYSDISSKKSDIVNLGVIQENPSSAKGTLEIMKYLDKYVPVSQEGRPYPILCHGDQLSVERMIDAKLSMAFSEDEVDQLRGLIPRPQGFHKRCIVLQDSMNRLFSGSTVGDKGSLFHIKNKFGFRPVKKKIQTVSTLL